MHTLCFKDMIAILRQSPFCESRQRRWHRVDPLQNIIYLFIVGPSKNADLESTVAASLLA